MRSRERYLSKVVLLGMMVCLCGGCGTEKAVMADSVGQEAETERETETEDALEKAVDSEEEEGGVDGKGTLAEEGQSGSENGEVEGETAQLRGAEGESAEIGKNDVSGNLLEQGEETKRAVSEEAAEEENWAPRREPVKVRGIYVSGPVAGIARMDELIDLVDQTELNAIVIDIKNDEGKVTYDMQSDQVLEIGAGVKYIRDIEALVAKCKEKDIYLIARIVAFRDPYLAEQKPEWAVHTKDGGIFRDKNGLAWVNPYERGVWDYLVEIASGAAAVGFDEVQFDYIRFSTDILADQVDYGPEAETVGKVEIITEFTEYLYERIRPLGVYVAADVFGTVIENETDQQIVGQDYVKMAEHLDYICPMIYPSHYRNGSYGIKVPDAEPYRTIHEACSASVQELSVLPEENRAHVRAWLQGFTASWVPGHISYGQRQIREQIKGAYDAGYDEWILWNAAVKYQRDLFLTDEEAEAERQQWELEKQQSMRTSEEQAAGEKEEETAGQQNVNIPEEKVTEEAAGQPAEAETEAITEQQAETAPEETAGQ